MSLVAVHDHPAAFPVPVLDGRIRNLVARRLRVDAGDVTTDAELIDDLAAGELDLAEIALAIEADLGVELPPRDVERVRTFGDLVGVVRARVRQPPPVEVDTPVLVHARILVGHPSRSTIERVLLLTPYAAETLIDDARWAGRGARLELTVEAGASNEVIASVLERLSQVERRGVTVQVRRR